MAYRLKRDPDSICKARSLLMPELGDHEAWELPDERIVWYAEETLNSIGGLTAPANTKLREVSHALGKTRRGRVLGRLFGCYPPPPPNIYERLYEVAERT